MTCQPAPSADSPPRMAKYRDEIDVGILRALLSYDEFSGWLIWRWRSVEWFSDGTCYSATTNQKRWNTQNAGCRAFGSKKNGGYFGMILKRPYQTHRVIWAMQVGSWPDGLIDHINGDPFDNRFVNLRIADAGINARNKRLLDSNTSGFCGVRVKKGRFYARATFMGKETHIGTFKTFDEATTARQKFNAENGFSSRHGTLDKIGS